MEDRSRSSRLVRELRETEGEEVSPSFWGVWVPPGAGVVLGGGGDRRNGTRTNSSSREGAHLNCGND